MKTAKRVSWVVYKMTLHGKLLGVNAICTQTEWDAIEVERPGYHTLVQTGIASEAEAEKIARGGPGDKPTATVRLKARLA
jgi:hypothetical protein